MRVRQWESLYRRYHASTTDWAERRFGSRAVAEDAVQEAFIQLIAHAPSGPVAAGSERAMIRRHTWWAGHKLMGRARASGPSR